jgi:hypothetical protein
MSVSESVPTEPSVSDSVWLTEPELRQRLNYSRATLARLRKRGLPHIGSGRLRRYSLPAVVQWLSEHV